MSVRIRVRMGVAVVLLLAARARAQPPAGLGTEEFGLSPKQLVESIEKVEALISKCMREHGFEYVAADATTVRRGMAADKNLPGVGEKEFIAKYGFGLSTMYTGQPPQLATGYSPARVGLGDRNIQIYKNLSPADQLAYNRALLGDNTGATFAVALDAENFSLTGGCTRRAIEQVFQPDQLKSTYYNPRDALIKKDPRMKAALRQYAVEMRKAGFEHSHPDDVETDVRERLAALTNGGTILVEKMSPEQQAALKELQDYERRVAAKNHQLQEDLFDPLEDKILEEMFARKPQ
jgi:hypothetical protein